MKLLEPKLVIEGFDISKYALEHNTELTKPYVYYHKARYSVRYHSNMARALDAIRLIPCFFLHGAFILISNSQKFSHKNNI